MVTFSGLFTGIAFAVANVLLAALVVEENLGQHAPGRVLGVVACLGFLMGLVLFDSFRFSPLHPSALKSPNTPTALPVILFATLFLHGIAVAAIATHEPALLLLPLFVCAYAFSSSLNRFRRRPMAFSADTVVLWGLILVAGLFAFMESRQLEDMAWWLERTFTASKHPTPVDYGYLSSSVSPLSGGLEIPLLVACGVAVGF